jgi:uncharacterized damage-inducible protein DinB
MNEVTGWFERRFDFSFPVELHPNICVRLRGAPVRLDELVRPAGREALIRKDREKWSAQETAGHLLDLEALWLARVEDFIAGTMDLTTADLSNRKTHEARHNERVMVDLLADFRAARSKLLRRVTELSPAMFGRTALHPRLKTPMRLVDHLLFVAEHDDHHLAQIWNQLGQNCDERPRSGANLTNF